MRSKLRVLAIFLGISSAVLFSQTPDIARAPTSSQPGKAPVPGQAADQQQRAQYDAEATRLRDTANAAFGKESARAKQPECTASNAKADSNTCLTRANELTNANYNAFTTALRAILVLTEPQRAGIQYSATGPTSLEATPATSTAAFDQAQTAWNTYAIAECAAVDTEWRGGALVDAKVLQCEQRQSRDRMQELDIAYAARLHPH